MSKKNVGQYRVIGHSRDNPCPRCSQSAYCDDCGFCEACEFSAPKVDLPHPPPPAAMLLCPECESTPSHDRTCSVTLRAAQN